MADQSIALPFPGGQLKLVDNGDGTYSLGVASSGGGGGSSEVAVTNFPATQPVSGPLTNAQLTAVTGTAAQTAIASEPDAPGLTVLSLLRAIMSQNRMLIEIGADSLAALEAIKNNTTPTP